MTAAVHSTAGQPAAERQEGHPVSGRLLTGTRLAVRRSHRKRHDKQGLRRDQAHASIPPLPAKLLR